MVVATTEDEPVERDEIEPSDIDERATVEEMKLAKEQRLIINKLCKVTKLNDPVGIFSFPIDKVRIVSGVEQRPLDLENVARIEKYIEENPNKQTTLAQFLVVDKNTTPADARKMILAGGELEVAITGGQHTMVAVRNLRQKQPGFFQDNQCEHHLTLHGHLYSMGNIKKLQAHFLDLKKLGKASYSPTTAERMYVDQRAAFLDMRRLVPELESFTPEDMGKIPNYEDAVTVLSEEHNVLPQSSARSKMSQKMIKARNAWISKGKPEASASDRNFMQPIKEIYGIGDDQLALRYAVLASVHEDVHEKLMILVALDEAGNVPARKPVPQESSAGRKKKKQAVQKKKTTVVPVSALHTLAALSLEPDTRESVIEVLDKIIKTEAYISDVAAMVSHLKVNNSLLIVLTGVVDK